MAEQLLRSIFEEISEKKLVLPDFQREFEWDDEKQRKLLSSVLVNLSIGSLLVIKGTVGDFISKKIGFSKNNQETPKEECNYLLDGQQRLTSLWSFFSDPYKSENITSKNTGSVYAKWEKAYDDLYKGLHKRWFVSLKSKGSSDFFGYDKLYFNVDQIEKSEPEEVLDQVIFKKFTKKSINDWYHPAFFANKQKKERVDDRKLLEAFIENAAKAGYLPLYITDDKHLCKRIIDTIATERYTKIISSLKTDLEMSEDFDIDSFKEKILDLFDESENDYSLSPDQREIISKWDSMDSVEKSMDDIYSALDSKKRDWVQHVLEYFTETLFKTSISEMSLQKDQISRAIAIFTAVNEGGQKLSTFDLVVAKAAKVYEEKSLLQEIKSAIDKPIKITKSALINNLSDYSEDEQKELDQWALCQMGCKTENSIEAKFKESFLNVLSGLVKSDYKHNKKTFTDNLKTDYFKNKSQLEMTPEDIADNFEDAMKALQRAHAFLQFRCGLINGTDLQFRLMLLPIAFCLLDDKCWTDKKSIDKLECWYWASIFSAYYREDQNRRSFEDIKYLYKTIVLNKNDDKSRTGFKNISDRKTDIFKVPEYCDKATLCMENSAKIPSSIHNSILQYVLSREPFDFLPKDKYEIYKLRAWKIAKIKYNSEGEKVKLINEESPDNIEKITDVQDHHIQPISSDKRLGESTKELRKDPDNALNSTLNRTLISNLANQKISNLMPKMYFEEIGENIIDSHYAYYYLKEDGSEVSIKEVLEKRFELLTVAIKSELDSLC